jgi:hypothetical protein
MCYRGGALPAVDVMKIFLNASEDKLGLPSAVQAVFESLTCNCKPAQVISVFPLSEGMTMNG